MQIIFYQQFSQSLKVFYYTLCMQTTLPPEVHSWNNYDNLCIRFDKAQELGKKEKNLAHWVMSSYLCTSAVTAVIEYFKINYNKIPKR